MAASQPLCVYREASILKLDVDYRAAKAGDGAAAARLVARHAGPLVASVRAAAVTGLTIATPHAEEASGDNAIPQVLGSFLATVAGLQIDDTIVQTSRAFHTGADPMERLISRPRSGGEVQPGTSYLLVDDVSTLGGTLAELSDFIQARGGIVSGVAVLANASRSGHLVAQPRVTRLVEGRLGAIVEEVFGIAPAALTRDESQYLIGFRDADEVRNRAAKARKARLDRLRARGIPAVDAR